MKRLKSVATLVAFLCVLSCTKTPTITTVTFDSNGGSFNDGETSLVVTGQAGSSLEKPVDPTWDIAHTFQGWDPEVPAVFPENNTIYKAVWAEVSVTVTFDAAGGKFADGKPTADISGLIGSPMTVPADPTWDEYHIFKGWEPELIATFPEKDATYTAKWEAIMGKVTFNARGGRFADGTNVIVLEGIPGTAIEVPANPTWADNKFVSWDWKEPVSVFPEKDADVTVGAIWDSMDIEFTTKFGTAKFKVVRVPAGTYKVGSPVSEPGHLWDETQHDVTFTKDYYIGIKEFPQKAWETVTGSNPSSKPMALDFSYVDNPVNCVAWQDICGENGDYGEDSFIFKLRQAVKESMGEDFEFRLPTEAEWETAARGGQSESLPFGIGNGRCLYWNMANFGISDSAYDMDKTEEWDGYVYDEEGEENCLNAYTPGGYYKDYANGYGCYDFHGNMAEWCWDWYNADYYTSAEAGMNPQGPENGTNKVLRGGWCMPFSSGGATSGGLAVECRSACRGMYPLKDSKNGRANGGPIGFRICITGFNK